MTRLIGMLRESGTSQFPNHQAQGWGHYSFSFLGRRRSGFQLVLLLFVGLALLGSSCGTSANTHSRSPSSTASGSTSSSVPSLAVSPNTNLVGGQKLQVSITGFPRSATVMVYQCANAASATNTNKCSDAIYLYTANSGEASGPFIAQPSVGYSQSKSICQDQCVLVGIVTKEGAKGLPSPPLIVTSSLSFSTTSTAALKDAFLQDLSWTSPAEGWAMANQPCATGLCIRLAHTTDSGKSWQPLPDPPAAVQSGAVNCSQVVCVSHLRFANSSIGYLFGPGLLMTTDGGHTWHAQHGQYVEMLKVSGGKVYRIAYSQGGCPGPCQPMLQESVPGSTTWKTLISQLTSPDRSATSQIVSSGSTLIVALYGSPAGPVIAQAVVYRSINNGVSWQRMNDPCAGLGPGGSGEEEDLISLAAAPRGYFAGLCSPHSGFATFVVSSSDYGQSWNIAGTLPKLQDLTQLATPSPSVIVVSTGATGGSGALTARLLISTDGGQNWTTAATDTQQITQMGVPAWLGFENSQVGRWISGPHSLWVTTDGGLHWKRTIFG